MSTSRPERLEENPESRIDTSVASAEEAAVAIVAFLQARGVLS
jgi:hypothetical protein